MRVSSLFELSQEEKDIANHQRIAAECAKSTRQRTQEAADRIFPPKEGFKRFRCAVLEKIGRKPMRASKAFPYVDVWAASELEASAYFAHISGILKCEHGYQITPIDPESDPAPEHFPHLQQASA